MCIWVLSFYHVSGFCSHSLEKGWSAWRLSNSISALDKQDRSTFTLDGKNCLYVKGEFEQESMKAERDHKLPLTVITQEVIRESPRLTSTYLASPCLLSCPFHVTDPTKNAWRLHHTTFIILSEPNGGQTFRQTLPISRILQLMSGACIYVPCVLPQLRLPGPTWPGVSICLGCWPGEQQLGFLEGCVFPQLVLFGCERLLFGCFILSSLCALGRV